MEARPTIGEREKSEDNGNGLLWRIVMDHQDIFDTHIVTKLNGNDVKFFYDVNRESRAAIQRSGAQVPDAFKIGDFDTKSTLSWALEKCSEKKERFCAEKWKLGLQFLERVSLGNLSACWRKWSSRVFEIRARKQVSLGCRYMCKGAAFLVTSSV